MFLSMLHMEVGERERERESGSQKVKKLSTWDAEMRVSASVCEERGTKKAIFFMFSFLGCGFHFNMPTLTSLFLLHDRQKHT